MKQFIIQTNDAGQRLDKFLQKAVKRLPQSLMYKYLRLKRIKVNGKRADIATRLVEGDVIELYINDEFFAGNPARPLFLSASSALNVLYEDENILLADKPQGLLCHDADSAPPDTLINRILRYLYEKGAYDPGRENSFTPALANRIDRNTGGIVMAAKNAESLRVLNQKIKAHEVDKRYLCVVHGTLKAASGTLTAYLLKDSEQNKVQLFDSPVPGAKPIETAYTVLARRNNLSLLEVRLITGRTHQIRAQFSKIGHPLLGDGKYGINQTDRRQGYKHQALYAYKLAFCFEGDAGCLQYLTGQSFAVKNVWFAQELFGM